MALSDFTFIKKLGEGAFSTVHKVKRKADGHVYALKKVNFGTLTSDNKENALNEIRLLASVKHTNIIGYKQAFMNSQTGHLYIIMELASNGDLQQRVNQCKIAHEKLKEEEIWEILLQATHGLKALHDLDIVHRDLKTANIFIHSNGTVKLGDLNIAAVAKQGLLHTQAGTPYYTSPEI